MTITATELKTNFGKYLKLVDNTDIAIKKNGKLIAVLTNPFKDRYEILNRIKSVLPSNINEKAIKDERLANV